jgi:hypothetical protein
VQRSPLDSIAGIQCGRAQADPAPCLEFAPEPFLFRPWHTGTNPGECSGQRPSTSASRQSPNQIKAGPRWIASRLSAGKGGRIAPDGILADHTIWRRRGDSCTARHPHGFTVAKLKVQQSQRLIVGGELGDAVTGRTQPLQSQFLTGDKNIISIRVVVQYSIGIPVDYPFRNENVARSVGAAIESALTERLAERNVDAVLTTEKQSIQEEVLAAAQQVINEYHSGVLLSTINIESAVPPPEAADAFRDVSSARADSSRIVSEAQGYANDVIPKARGQASRCCRPLGHIEKGRSTRQKAILLVSHRSPSSMRRPPMLADKGFISKR